MTSELQPATLRPATLQPATLRTVTLGCRVNQYETEFCRQALHSIGYQDAHADSAADLCIVNTCTVTAEGDAKSRQTIRQLARRNPDARIVVMGCYATREPDIVAKLPGVAEVVTDKRELPDLLGRFGIVDVPSGLSGFVGRKRAYVKVQDGCLLRCSFCIIPHVRPTMVSRPADDIISEVSRLVHSGHREIVLCGIHLGHYGVDRNRGVPKRNWTRLANLLERLANLPGEFRIRLSSIEATEVTRELLEVMQAYPRRVCPHLHVSMQSGSDRILRRMNRRWGSKRFVDRCLLAREMLDQPAFSTDVIVGFPGETDDDFALTCDVLETVGFSRIHCFPFSARKPTPAATMPDQISKEIKSARVQHIAQLEAQLRSRYAQTLLDRPLQVLIEGCLDKQHVGCLDNKLEVALENKHEGQLPTHREHAMPTRVMGTSCRYLPVELDGDASSVNRLLWVQPERFDGTTMHGRACQEPIVATPQLLVN